MMEDNQEFDGPYEEEEEEVREEEPREEELPKDAEIPEDTERLKQIAMNLHTAMPARSLPKQEYLQATIVPLLLEGLSWIIKERPDDPVEHLAMFLIKNNPLAPELHQTIDLSEYE